MEMEMEIDVNCDNNDIVHNDKATIPVKKEHLNIDSW